MNNRVIELVDILKDKDIEIGTILRNKLRKYYVYYIVVGYHKTMESLVTLRFYKTMPKNQKEILCYCNYGACENKNTSCFIKPKLLNYYEVFGKVEDRIVENITYYLSDYAKDYMDLLNYSEILKNIKIGSVLCFNKLEYLILINKDKGKYSFLSMLAIYNLMTKEDIKNNLILGDVKEIQLENLNKFSHRSKYVLDIEEDVIKNIVMKLRLLKKI